MIWQPAQSKVVCEPTRTYEMRDYEMLSRNRLKRIGNNLLKSAAALVAAIGVCALLSTIYDDNNPFASPVFILAVAVTARITSGYVYGIAASVAAVFCVNFMFTYPFCEFDMSISGYPLTFLSMLVVSVIISTLTSQIKRQEQLKYEIETEKMRGNLLRSISHDLRTPLSSIIGASSAMLENDDMDKAARDDLLTEIHKDANWLIRVTENLLSVTKFAGGEEYVSLKKESEVLEEIVGSAIVKFRKNHPELPVIVSKPEKILLVEMDATLIEQVLINLFENVVYHAKTATKINVRIVWEPDRVGVQVRDDGIGFPPQVLSHAFDGRCDVIQKNSDGRRNMGIGLSVCRSIIRAHGGDISAENTEVGGGMIRFWLPYKEEENAY